MKSTSPREELASLTRILGLARVDIPQLGLGEKSAFLGK